MASDNRITPSIAILSLALTSIVARTSLSSVPHGSPTLALLHDILNSNGLLIGLFLKGISDFSFDATTGEFVLQLHYPTPCDAELETYVRSNITGSIGYGKIANLYGMVVQELFVWLPIKGIDEVDIPSLGPLFAFAVLGCLGGIMKTARFGVRVLIEWIKWRWYWGVRVVLVDKDQSRS